MTRRMMKFLERIHAGRKRLRDDAAADAAMANERQRLARAQWQAASDDFSETMASAPEQMCRATSSSRLTLVANELSALRGGIDTADLVLGDAGAQAQAASSRLRLRERELRIAEKQLEAVRTELDRRAAKAEQAAADDLSAQRRRIA